MAIVFEGGFHFIFDDHHADYRIKLVVCILHENEIWLKFKMATIVLNFFRQVGMVFFAQVFNNASIMNISFVIDVDSGCQNKFI
jgi:hypothetical protein